ncbi:Transcriptional regulator NanR [Rhodococcus sp. T7]|nr:Transcriptional regulator NanR [Rhodococcus sp. T7]
MLTPSPGRAQNIPMNLSDSWAARRPVTARVSAAEAVLADLRDAITSGELSVGERLPSEASLAARHGVSRSVIREALRSCHALGLTETKSGLGTFVVSDSIARDLDFGNYAANELVEARPHVEIPAAGWAAQRHTAEDLAALRGLVDQMRDEDDPLVWVSLDAQFHAFIARTSRNRVFESVIVDIREALTRQSETLNLVAGRQQKSNDEHDRIVDGIASGSYDKAARAMAEHLDAVRVALESVVGEAGPDDRQ